MPESVIFFDGLEASKDPFLCSIARHGFLIEVGPVAQGLLRWDVFEQTYNALSHALDFIALQRAGQVELPAEREAEVGTNAVDALGPDERHPCTCVAAVGNGSEVVELITVEVDELRALTTAASVRDVYERHDERMHPYLPGLTPADAITGSSGRGLSALAASQKSTRNRRSHAASACASG